MSAKLAANRRVWASACVLLQQPSALALSVHCLSSIASSQTATSPVQKTTTIQSFSLISQSNSLSLRNASTTTPATSTTATTAGVLPTDRRRRVVVTGFGAITPLGVGALYAWEQLCLAKSGIITASHKEFADLPHRMHGRVANGKAPHLFDLDRHYPPEARENITLPTVYSLLTADEALTRSGWKPADQDERARTGVSIGSCMGDLHRMYAEARQFNANGMDAEKIKSNEIFKVYLNAPASHVAVNFGFGGPNRTVSTACATGLHSIGDSFKLVRNGDADVMLAGGVEGALEDMGAIFTASFAKIRALSTKYNKTPAKASRPFDADRDGFVMGEGCGLMVVEELEHAKRRGASIFGEVLGYGTSGDAFHISAPTLDGSGGSRAMKSCLRDAGLQPTDVGHINCHATSTPIGDPIECLAIENVFGEHTSSLLVTANKGATGHMLGATGAVESIFTLLACHFGRVPPILNLTKLDPHILKIPHRPQFVTGAAKEWPAAPGRRRVALKNAFGFGGTNASVAFSNFIE